MKNFLLFIIILSLSHTSHGLKIEITKGDVRPDPIAVTEFYSNDNAEVGQKIAEVVGQDLEGSWLFQLISKNAFIQTNESLNKDGPRFTDWRVINSRFLVGGNIKQESSKTAVEFRLYDIIAGQQMMGLEVGGKPDKWRRIAHNIADSIYNRVTNEKGYFDTQIVYVESVKPRGRNHTTRLMIMDQDGENAVPLTDGQNLVLTPRFSPDGKKVAYLAYINKTARIYLIDIASKSKKVLGEFGEMNFAPRFSPDGSMVVMSLVKKGKSAIYVYNINQHRITPLTEHISIDTSPCFSADGKNIVFTSDRGGKEQLYVMDVNGHNVRRISFAEGKYSQPVWSPRGDMICFTKQIKNQFYIGVIAPDGTGERLIANGYLVEGPSWAPNGRYIIFSKEARPGAKSQIHCVDLTGRNIRMIKTPKDASDCTWSPVHVY